MQKARKPPTEQPLLIEIDPEPLPETLTALGGVPLLVQTFRSLGLPVSVRQHVHVRERDRGYDEATMVESFVILKRGARRVLRRSPAVAGRSGIERTIGTDSPGRARQFLYQFQ
ncbi:MAG: hypothetical protein KIT09_02640 [Bryobacteraceae bacterium]|nr:hypothetical protein [Bryobacteraceae bacterium]